MPIHWGNSSDRGTGVERFWTGGFGLRACADFAALRTPPWPALKPGSRLNSSLHRFPFVFLCFVAVAGVAADAVFYASLRTSLILWGTVAAIATVVPFVVRAFSRNRSAGSKLIGRVVTWVGNAVLLTCAFGVLHAWSEHHYRSASILSMVERSDQPIVVRGRLKRTVSLRRNPLSFGSGRREVALWQSQLQLAVEQHRTVDGFRDLSGTVLVYVDGDLSELRPGARLEIYGWLKSFKAPTNPGEPDLRPVYRRRGLHGRIETKNASAVTVLSQSNRPLQSLVASIASGGRDSLLRHTDQQTGSLAIALVLGQREFVDPKTRDALLATGTAHLLSVSGMHLAILVLVAGWGISALGLQPRSRFLLIVVLSCFYVAVTGGRPPVMRAAILIAMLLLATCFRRTSQPLNTLAIAAVILIVINPTNVFAVGVHLSFLAVITLMLAGRPIAPGSMRSEIELQREASFQTLIESSSGRWMATARTLLRFVGQMAWLSVCVSAISFPLVWSQFHLVSFVSVVTNVLVWGGLMIALPAGVLTVILDPIATWLGAIPGTACHYSLWYMWTVIEWTANWRGGHLWLPAPPDGWVAVFYVVIAATLMCKSRRGRWLRSGWVIVWGITAYAAATSVRPLPEGTLEATFIDVGHGTSVIVRTADERVWLYDCGRMGNYRGTSRDIDSALWALGITRLDGVFLSHADSDHYNAFPALAERFSIGHLITPPSMLESQDEGLGGVRAAIDRHKINVVESSAGDQLSDLLPGTIADRRSAPILVLHPPRSGVAGNDNANSLVLRFDVGPRVLLLPGDLEPPGTSSLISRDRPPSGAVLMAPHHGSLSMDADAVLAWSRPAEVVVSGGARAARIEVSEMLSVTGSGVHVTAKVGAVRVRLDRTGQVEVRSWRQHPW